MTSQQDKIRQLIAEIDAVLGEASPRLPWEKSGEINQQRQTLEKIRAYLNSPSALAQAPLAAQNTSPETAPMSPETSAQQVLQALLQEMDYLRTQMLQPMRTEVDALQQQRDSLLQEVRHLELERLRGTVDRELPPSLANFLQVLNEQMQEALTQRLTQAIEQSNRDRLLQGDTTTDLLGEGSGQQLAQIQRLQAQSDQLLLRLDSTLTTVFEALQNSIDSYQESLSQGLKNMHSLGQQGEVVVAALINHLAERLSREASAYLTSEARSPEIQRLLAAQSDTYETAATTEIADIAASEANAEVSPDLSAAALDLEALDLDFDFDEDEDITLLQLDQEITQLQLDDESATENLTADTEATDTETTDTEANLTPEEPTASAITDSEPLDFLAAATPAAAARPDSPQADIDTLYESLFGLEDITIAEDEPQPLAPDEPVSSQTAASAEGSNLAPDETAETEDLAAEATAADLPEPGTQQSQDLDALLLGEMSAPTETPSTPITLDSFFANDDEDTLIQATDTVPETISSLAELLPESDRSRPADSFLGALDEETNLAAELLAEDAYVPAPPNEDLLVDEILPESDSAELELDASVLQQLSADLSSLEGLDSDALNDTVDLMGDRAENGPNFAADSAESEIAPDPTTTAPLSDWSTLADELQAENAENIEAVAETGATLEDLMSTAARQSAAAETAASLSLAALDELDLENSDLDEDDEEDREPSSQSADDATLFDTVDDAAAETAAALDNLSAGQIDDPAESDPSSAEPTDLSSASLASPSPAASSAETLQPEASAAASLAEAADQFAATASALPPEAPNPVQQRTFAAEADDSSPEAELSAPESAVKPDIPDADPLSSREDSLTAETEPADLRVDSPEEAAATKPLPATDDPVAAATVLPTGPETASAEEQLGSATIDGGLPPAEDETEPAQQWFLSLDLGTTGLSAVLMDRLSNQVYPLYWLAADTATAADERNFRLPAIAQVRTHSAAESAQWQVEAVGLSALTRSQSSSAATPSPDQLMLRHFKPLLKVTVPLDEMTPQLQWSERHQLPLASVQAVLQQLLANLRDRACAALGLTQPLPDVLDQLQGVIVGYPANWPDTYSFNIREAVLAAQLVSQPEQVFFVEDAIAVVLSGLPQPTADTEPTASGVTRQQTLYQARWQGGTVVIDGGATLTELAVVTVPADLMALNHKDFTLRSFAYGGDAIDQDIVCQLLYPSHTWQIRDRAAQTTASGPSQSAGWNWQAASLISTADWQDLQLENLTLPRPGEADLEHRHRLQQRLNSSLVGQSLLEAARHLKLILQHQGQFQLNLGNRQWTIKRRELESRIFLPYIQRVNQQLNMLLSQTGLSAQAVNQVVCTGGSASLAAFARWLRQKFPNATIIQDTYPGDRPPSCSRVAYGLVNLCRYPEVLEIARQQYSDYFLLAELLRVFPDHPLPVSGIMHHLEEQGINTQVCQMHILALLEGHLPPGLIPTETDAALITAESAQQAEYAALAAAPLFTKQGNQIYVPNLEQSERLKQHLETLLANKQQTLDEPLITNLVAEMP
ncbi:MAG: hypothetical protein F6K04_12400 [Leptolyngbya sp. SIO4C5]|nr:hypothetical protein [Leptolyngbya sp. SIO4C5]